MRHLHITTILLLLLSANSVLAAAGGVADGFNFSHWAERLHIFWISFCLMTGGSIIYGVLLRKKRRRDSDDT